MAISPKDPTARKSIGKFARTLLATTCLTVAGGAAQAGTIIYTEGTAPAPADFSNTFPAATVLTAAAIPGTTTVNGNISGGDPFDFFELTGLGAGTFTVTASTSGSGMGSVSVLTDANVVVGGPTGISNGVSASFGSFSIPSDGNIVVELQDLGERSTPYTVTVNTLSSSTPEPSTIATVGLGLAGALALSRKRRKQ